VVRSEVAEDLAIGQAFVRKGLKVRVWWAEELIRTRMYTGLGSLIEGWSKNLYLGSRASFPDEPVWRALAPFIVIAGQLFWLAPLAALAAGADWAPWALGLGLVFWALIALGMQIPIWYAVTWPLGAMMVLLLMLRSAFRGTRRVEWRGRVYRDARAAESGAPS
jgi:hypothetical protein